jgi:hypothetical protein
MPDSTLQQLRDVILLEADWLQAHAQRLNLMGKRAGTPWLNEVASQCRDRARHLHEVLVASEPKAEAS